MLEFIPSRQVPQRLSEGWSIVAQRDGDYAAVMYAPEGWLPLRMNDKKPFRVCSVHDCDAKHYAHGFCEKHMLRFKAHGDPNIVIRGSRGFECSEPGCHKKRKGRGLCEMHLQRVRRAERRARKIAVAA